MASPKQISANRANAQRSTGPRSRTGKARSRSNALRHGLSLPASALPALAPEIAQLARRLIGDRTDRPALLQAATHVAEATFDVLRVRRTRGEVLERMLFNATATKAPASDVALLEGSDQTMLEAEVAQMWQEAAYGRTVTPLSQQHGEAQTEASLAADWRLLARLDRYERRAVSKRNKAIARFNDLHEALAVEDGSLWQNEPNEEGNGL